ncbi:MAG TPA: NrtA/SsuA/CpmA family ABC transporter substrate-binding protein [Rhodocyclaceae bacterium]|nr:NrtA/SsuA/CpmA family ABC transporter substrate-binding protein [Rhodocyclaceae bacterium]
MVRSPLPPQEKLTIAVNNIYPGSGLLYVAAKQGYFTQEGLDVTFQPHSSGRDALKAALDKRAELGTVADIPVMFAAVAGQPVSIVATLYTASRTHGIVARRDRGIAGIADLKNKVVGVTLRTDSHFVLSTMLARQRIALSEVRIEDLAPEAMLTALQSGKVDAVSTWEPGLSTASKALGENGVEFRSEKRFVFNFNLAGQTDWVKANPGKIQGLLRALLRAKRFADEKPQQARTMIVDAIKMDPGIFTAIGPHYHFVVQLNQNLLLMLEDQARWAIQTKLTDRTVIPNFLDHIYMDPLTAVQADAVTIVR